MIMCACGGAMFDGIMVNTVDRLAACHAWIDVLFPYSMCFNWCGRASGQSVRM